MSANKQGESDSCLLSDSLEVRGKGKQTAEITKRPKTAKEKSGEKIKDKKRFFNAIGCGHTWAFFTIVKSSLLL